MTDTTTAPVGAAPRATIKTNKFIYQGQLGSLYGLWIKKILLSILTLGIYSFWGKTNLRRYMVASVELEGDRFEYLGTGKELFLGMLKIGPIYAVLVITTAVLQHMFGEQAGSLVFIPVFLIIPAALYSAFRYRMNRLSWRGIRTRMAGSAFAYCGLYLKGFFIKLFTLGFMGPSVDLERWGYQVQHMQYGDIPFAFSGDASRLSKSNITTLLLFIPTLGLSRIWYNASLQQEMMRGLSLGPIRFRSSAKGGDFAKLALGNMLLLICTLGLGAPIVMQRNVRFFANFHAIGGDLSQLSVAQVPKGRAGDAGEALDVLDIDIGVIGA